MAIQAACHFLLLWINIMTNIRLFFESIVDYILEGILKYEYEDSFWVAFQKAYTGI